MGINPSLPVRVGLCIYECKKKHQFFTGQEPNEPWPKITTKEENKTSEQSVNNKDITNTEICEAALWQRGVTMINVGVNILNNPKGAGVGPPPSPEGGPPTHNRGRRKGPVNRSNEPSRLLLLIDSKHLIMLFNWDFLLARINYFLFFCLLHTSSRWNRFDIIK